MSMWTEEATKLELHLANSRIKELEATTVPLSDVVPLLDACESIVAEGSCHSGYCECSQCEAFTALNKALPAFYSKHPTLEEQ